MPKGEVDYVTCAFDCNREHQPPASLSAGIQAACPGNFSRQKQKYSTNRGACLSFVLPPDKIGVSSAMFVLPMTIFGEPIRCPLGA
jgi:hypothetical protein